jgi:hypothetical protein
VFFAPSRGLTCGTIAILATTLSTWFTPPLRAAQAAAPRPAEDATVRQSSPQPPRPAHVSLAHGAILSLTASSTPTTIHAANYLRSELRRLHGIEATISNEASPPSDERVQVIFGEAGTSDPRLTDASASPPPGPDGYILHVSADRRRAIVLDGGGNGIIRGAFALAQLAGTQAGEPLWPAGTVSDAPELKIRMTREIFPDNHPPANMSREEIDRCQLDWWARWGLNHTFLPSEAAKTLPGQVEYAKWYLREAHDRGMKVGANLGGRSLCASDAVEMNAYLEQARRLLALGCDYLVVLFDDLPSTRTAGHCDRCIQQFGGSLAREQRHILESLQKTIDEFGPDRKLIWCPTYYSLGMTGYRNAAEGPEAYFSILGDSPQVRRAWMYHCAFDGAFMAYLDGKHLTRRVWWYNGIRTQYYMVSRDFDGYEPWGERLVIPGLKDFHSFFSPFENGWLMPGFKTADPSLHPCVSPLATASRDADNRTMISPESWAELRQIGGRMDGAYFCGACTPYHIGLMGVFAAHPRQFDSAKAAQLVMTAMFGARGQELAARWEDAYAKAQMILARAKGQLLAGQPLEDLKALAATMAALEPQLRACVQTDSPALPRAVLDPLLDEMTDWRQKTQALAIQPPEPQTTRPEQQRGRSVP